MADATVTYIRRIKNPVKKAYATAVLRWMQNPGMNNEPEFPDNLSYMAAQAVRHQLSAYINGAGK